MSIALLPVLEQLARETKDFLLCSALDPAAWESYSERRAAIFSQLHTIDVADHEREDPVIVALVDEVSRQERLVLEKAQEQLAFFRAELQTLVTFQQALRGYRPSVPIAVLDRNA
jgi:hypothetical protein